MTVTVVSCVYGQHYQQFIPRWLEAVQALDPKPDAVIVAADRHLDIPDLRVVESLCRWNHPQAWYLQSAITAATTDWVWILDIDDLAYPDALRGLDEIAADVWQVGFERSDGEFYTPPRMSPAEYLASEGNPYVGTSMFRTDIFTEVGGFDDIALQDWGLWRKLCRVGATVEPSTRPHFAYMRHPLTRGSTELTLDVREGHLQEMMKVELVPAA